ERHDHIDLKPDELGRKLGKSIQLSFCRAKLKCNAFPFLIAKFMQPVLKFFLERLGVCESYVECAYSSHLGLRARRERPRRRRAAEQRDEVAPSQGWHGLSPPVQPVSPSA